MSNSEKSFLKNSKTIAKDFIAKTINDTKVKIVDSLKQQVEKSQNKITSLIEESTDKVINKTDEVIKHNIEKGADYLVSKIPANVEILPDDNEKRYHDNDNTFVSNVSTGIYKTGVDALTNRTANQPIDIMNKLADIAADVEKFREAQKTKRTAIEADKEMFISRINAQKEVLLLHLEKTFDERKEIFKKYFDVIDDALQKDNTQQLVVGLNSVTDLAKSSPFKDLADINQIGMALQDENYEWDF